MINPYHAPDVNISRNPLAGSIAGIFVNAMLFIAFIYAYLLIVPKFQRMFVELNMILPGVSVFILGVSHCLQSGLFAISVVYGCVIIYIIKKKIFTHSYFPKVLWIHGIVLLVGLILVPIGLFLPIMALQENLK